MKGLFQAVGFLTVVPVGRWSAAGEGGSLAPAMKWFPVVGALQGTVLAGAAYGLSHILPWPLISALLIALLAFTNGAFHLDGFIDTVDGLAGGSSPTDRLRIMKDTSAGAVGVAAVVILLIVKYAALLTLSGEYVLGAVFLFPVAGRWAMVPLGASLPYARDDGGLAAAFDGVGKGALLLATVLTVAFTVPVAGVHGLVSLVVVLFCTVLAAVFFKARLGGVTGDVYGFHSELSEVIFLITLISMYNII